MSTRSFRLNTHLIIPIDLLAGPGAAHSRHEPGDVVELDVERCRVHDRFLRGRIRAGDLTEIEDAPAPALVQRPAPASAPAPVKE